MNIDELIRRNLSGEATIEERRQLQNWLLEDKKNELLYQEIYRRWHVNQTLPHEQINANWRRLAKRLEFQTKAISMSEAKIRSFSFFRIAATILVLSIVAISLWYISADAQKESDWLTYENPAGEKSEITLSDGSVVFLSAASSLKVPKSFTEDRRDIYLEGEAFFEVEEDKTRPFTVFTQNISTTALGTSFNILAFPNDKHIEVALADGKVDVKINDKTEDNAVSVILLPGESITYYRASEEHAKTNFQGNLPYSWKEGMIFFDKSDAQEVTTKLTRWFGKEFEIPEEFNSQSRLRYKLDVNNLSLEEALEEITMLVDYKFERKGSIYQVKIK